VRVPKSFRRPADTQRGCAVMAQFGSAVMAQLIIA
jgi:hypothetical protein